MTFSPNAVARLRDESEEESTKPYLARGSRAPRCHTCRVIESHCLCRWRPKVSSRSGVCLLMTKKEVFKPSNTGWLIADVVNDNFVEKAGAWYSYNGNKIGQGKANSAKFLDDNPDIKDALEKQLRAKLLGPKTESELAELKVMPKMSKAAKAAAEEAEAAEIEFENSAENDN